MSCFGIVSGGLRPECSFSTKAGQCFLLAAFTWAKSFQHDASTMNQILGVPLRLHTFNSWLVIRIRVPNEKAATVGDLVVFLLAPEISSWDE